MQDGLSDEVQLLSQGLGLDSVHELHVGQVEHDRLTIFHALSGSLALVLLSFLAFSYEDLQFLLCHFFHLGFELVFLCFSSLGVPFLLVLGVTKILLKPLHLSIYFLAPGLIEFVSEPFLSLELFHAFLEDPNKRVAFLLLQHWQFLL